VTAALAISPPRTGAWSPDEDAILRANYQKRGAYKTADLIGRSVHSVFHRAQRLKIFTHARWTKADDRRLSLLWGEIPLASVAKEMNRTIDACYARARDLGLKRGIQEHVEHITAAAKRTGYSREALRLILKWAKVGGITAMSRPGHGGTRRLRGYDPLEVDKAIESWMAAEYVDDAGRRVGIHGGTLARWLEEAGHKRPDRKRRWRVSIAEVDAVVKARRGLESVRQAANRVGVGRGTLARLLSAAGVQHADYRWYVDPADVDRAVAGLTDRQRSYIARARVVREARARGEA